MDDILAWGLEVVRSVQTAASPGLTAFFRFLSLLGTEYFFLFALPVVYWCVDRRKGIRLGLLVLVSAVVNSWLKVVFRQPRPYNLDPSVGMAREVTYGLPSAHAQNSTTFWGVLAPWIRNPWGLVLALVLPFLIGLSRVYLGVHFPTDVFLGWALGALFAVSHRIWGDALEALVERLPGRLWIAAAAAAALGMNALNPEETGLPGALFGLVVGAALASSRARFDAASGSLARKALRLAAGTAGAAAIYFGLKVVLPGEGSANYALFRFLRYGVLGAWVSLGAPWVFLRLGLAEERAAVTPRT
jgi:hypothetical protein